MQTSHKNQALGSFGAHRCPSTSAAKCIKCTTLLQKITWFIILYGLGLLIVIQNSDNSSIDDSKHWDNGDLVLSQLIFSFNVLQ